MAVEVKERDYFLYTANETLSKSCPEYKVPNILVATLGITTVVLGVAGSFLTWIYLFMFRQASRVGAISGGDTCNSTGSGRRKPGQRSLRASTQLLMASLALVDCFGQLISCMRYTILVITQYDIRLFYTDVFCRLQLFGEYCSQDGSAWLMCGVSLERFWLMLKPTSTYSRSKTMITPAAVGIIVSCLITMVKNAILLSPNQDVCGSAYIDATFFFVDMIYKCLIPFIILMITSIGNMVLMQRQLVKMHANHMTIKKGLSIITMSKKERAKLPPTTAALWEVIFACRMMIVSGAVFMVGALPMNLFKLFHSDFKNVLTAKSICSTTDVIYNCINIIFWTCVGLRFYLYMFSSPRMRNDMLLILKISLFRMRCIKSLGASSAAASEAEATQSETSAQPKRSEPQNDKSATGTQEK